MRPRGMPPIPSARSSDSAPVGIAATFTWAPSSPMRMTVPLPNWRSICARAPCRAASRALASWVLIWRRSLDVGPDRSLHAMARNDAQKCEKSAQGGARAQRARGGGDWRCAHGSAELEPDDRLVPGTARVQARDEQRERLAEELEGLRSGLDRPWGAGPGTEAGDGGVGPERARLRRVHPGGREAVADARLEVAERSVDIVERGGQDAGAARREQERRPEREPGRGADRRVEDLVDRREIGRRTASEEGEREVERVRRDRALDGRVGRGIAERGQRVAGGGRKFERDEEPEVVGPGGGR